MLDEGMIPDELYPEAIEESVEEHQEVVEEKEDEELFLSSSFSHKPVSSLTDFMQQFWEDKLFAPLVPVSR